MRRAVKNLLKRLFFLVHRQAARLGVHVLPVHYYSPVPDVLELDRTRERWARPSALAGIEVDLEEQVRNLRRICLPLREEYRDNGNYLRGVRDGYGPGFGFVEAQALHAVVRHYKPARILEVGSGVSTFCAHRAAEANQRESGRACRITCVEPAPSRPLRELAARGSAVELLDLPVQSVGPGEFATLGPADILFIDSSHVVKTGSDTEFLLLEVLPRLGPGVLVHFHNIYMPYTYQTNALESFFHSNETAFLQAFLIENRRTRILFCLSHLHHARPEALKEAFPDYVPASFTDGLRDARFDPHHHFPSSIWLERR